MSFNLSTASLRSLLSLAEKRESLLIEIGKIDSEISRVLQDGTLDHQANSTNIDKKSGRPKKISSEIPKAAKVGKRGRVKELILAALKEAGEAGVAVRHLAAKHGLKPGSVHVWFGTTGKKSGLIEALGKGVYRLKASMGAEAPQSPLEAPKPKATRRKTARNHKKKGV